jgi:HJR/Mrr/RecB family endonuclease
VYKFITLILLFADKSKIYRAIKPVGDRRCFQTDINELHGCRFEKYMKLHVEEPSVISVSRDTSSVSFNCHIGDVLV